MSEIKLGKNRKGKTYKIGGEEFKLLEEDPNRVLSEGIPFVITDVKKKNLVIKEGELFLYTDLEGNADRFNNSGFGLYYKDTRFLSIFEMKIGSKDAVLLSSTADRNYSSQIELTNAEIPLNSGNFIPQETINIRRLRVIDDRLYERIRLKNYNNFPVDFDLRLILDSDFADIFEVRGLRRTSPRGKKLKAKSNHDSILLAYIGGDEVFRRTKIEFLTPPDRIEDNEAIFHIHLEPDGRLYLNFSVDPLIGEAELPRGDFSRSVGDLRVEYERWQDQCTRIFTDNELFNTMLERGQRDIRLLLSETPVGNIMVGGIPWYVAPFGRDSIITCLQTMMLNPDPSIETARVLARYQGDRVDEWRDEEPGKILHEVRQGELAGVKEIPHTPYFGGVDTTPLFLILVSDIFKWTNDFQLMIELLPAIESALKWIDEYGDSDRDLFVEYQRKSKRGLLNQGWKDSFAAVINVDGSIAEPPISICEVQGYVYYAKKRMSELFKFLGDYNTSSRLAVEAEALKKKFNDVFWLKNENYFAMAIDGSGRLIETVTSNPGHCLWSGIIDEDKASHVSRRLLESDMFSGWGIRTMSKSSPHYNPMSYHNGSVWPHDNAMIMKGLMRYGYLEEANSILTGLFEAATHYDYFRLPELFCGFTKRGNNRPVNYPVACSPQSWAAGSVYMMTQAMLGLEADAPNNTLYVNRPMLPRWLNQVELHDLRVGSSKLSMVFRREGSVTSFTVKKKEGELKIIMEE